MGDMRPRPSESNSKDQTEPLSDAGSEASRSQRRREALDVLKLAHSLSDMSDAQLKSIPLSDDLRAEVQRARAVKQQIARKRQNQFVAKLMRRLDDDELESIRAALEHDRDLARRDTAELHQVESWRERLVADGDEALTSLLDAYPRADRQQLRQLARQARLERDQNKPLHAYRELFRQLRELMEAVTGDPQDT